MGNHFLLQRILPTQGLNPCLLNLLHWQMGSFTTSATCVMTEVAPGKINLDMTFGERRLEHLRTWNVCLITHLSDWCLSHAICCIWCHRASLGKEKSVVSQHEEVGPESWYLIFLWHHWLNGHEFEETPGVGDAQGGLACCNLWGCKELDTTEWLNCTTLIFIQLSASKLLSLSEFLKNKLATFHQDLPLLAPVSCFLFLNFILISDHSSICQYVLTTLICYCLFSISSPGRSLFIQCFYSHYTGVSVVTVACQVTVAWQAPLSMGFPRQEYWSGLPFPPTGDLPNPGIEPVSLMSPELAGRFFTTSTTWEILSSNQRR